MPRLNNNIEQKKLSLVENNSAVYTSEHGNLEDLKQKIDYYILDGLTREEIRIAGHERTKKEHTYVHRWASIMNELGIK